MRNNNQKIAVIGGGSWGTALAVLLGNKGLNTHLWVRREELVREIQNTHINPEYLSRAYIPDSVTVSSVMSDVVNNADLTIVVVPSQYMRAVVKDMKSHLMDKAIVCSASKGIEMGSFKRMSQVLREELGISRKHIAVLSGPSHAEEVCMGKATAVVSASSSNKVAEYVQQIFSTSTFRVYTSRDVRGVEYGGALKNVVAIGAGICDGLQKIDLEDRQSSVGDNAKASLLTRGIEEMARMGLYLGSRKNTFYGLSGWGDLLVTAYSRFGRNRMVGECLAMGMTMEQIKTEKLQGMVSEGVETARAAYELSRTINVEMPITEQTYKVIYEGKDIETAIHDLMSRIPKPEHGYYIKGIPKRLLLALKGRT
ncbi:NAD(P)H-dependent glycerol-3-phosphate dehydrogenase [Candidatus Poribacteria bacterium]|nr:NAD(P)H-dependent glycerol-3-phosphate dehydrogenase [Candidatus Poribacteria bacterium]